MRRALTLLAALLSVAYPILVYFTLGHVQPAAFAIVLIILAALRAYTGRAQQGIAVQVAILLLFAALLLLHGNAQILRWYPVLMNIGMLGVFGLSLSQSHGPPVIERLARITEPDLPEAGVRYTRRVTQVWCGFFIVNGSIAAWTAAFADWASWTLYNGLIAYVLIGLLLAGEWILRLRIRAKS